MAFSAAWLALREPADLAARDPGLLSAAADVAAAGAAGAPIVVDLGAGAGATARALGPSLAGARWRMVDHDADLLRLATAGRPEAEAHPRDLVEVETLPLDGAAMVTASALLDLVSRDWLVRLADRLAALGLPFYAALSYDGALDWAPALEADGAVAAAFNRDQRRDKGLGPALGPDAAAAAAEVFAARGHAVRLAPSPWRLDARHAALQVELNAGIAEAADRAGAAEARAWAVRRTDLGTAGRCTVGHLDLLAVPPSGAAAHARAAAARS